MKEGQSVSYHVLKIKSYIDKLERLGHTLPHVLEGIRSSKRLEKGAIVLHMRNGNQAEVEDIGTSFLNVPSGMELFLEQCHYTPTIARCVISVSRLRDAVFELGIKHYGISVSKNNIFNAFPRNDIFEIDGVISIDKYVFHVTK
ncbi:hypothetical protein Tco_0952272 [Tanacetum coccineum]|uniref:Uncharacterized protein n=1 Tax=Tanacetum coccineum TaxID=301880 RepID=A0ABQ5DWL2_9ASTR